MLRLSCALFALALPGQVQAPAAEPQWLRDLQTVQQDMYQAAIGSLDAKVESAWRAALQTPDSVHFQNAAQMVANFYRSQGFDLKAEQVLRQAIAAVPAFEIERRRNLTNSLAGHFEMTEQLVKAVSVREEMLKQARSPDMASQTLPCCELIGLASLYERMGEFEKAEAAWKEIVAAREAEDAERASHPEQRTIFIRGPFGGAPNELADFYTRHGRKGDAEEMYKSALARASQGEATNDWVAAATNYVNFLSGESRFDEALPLLRQVMARLEPVSDPSARWTLFQKRQQFANLLSRAGRSDEAIAEQKAMVEAAAPQGSSEHAQALELLAQTLINTKRFDEAEKVVTAMRELASSDPVNARSHEWRAVQTLARMREVQQKPEEARELRASVQMGDAGAPNRPPTLFDIAGRAAQQAAVQGNVEPALAVSDEVLSAAAERIRAFPQEAVAVANLANILFSRQKEREARRLAAETLRILDQTPDHPRVADALASVVPVLTQLGMTAEAESAIERQRKIIVSAKGSDSMALNSVSRGSIALMKSGSEAAAAVDEYKRMLARTEATTGPKSQTSLYALREVAWAYPALNRWSEEQSVLATLRERTVHVFGASSLDHAHLLVHTANRASDNRDFDKAIRSIDEAIEITRGLPDAGSQLPSMLENRTRILQARDAAAAPRFYTPTPDESGSRWFDTNRFRATTGNTIRGTAPARAPAKSPSPAGAKP